MADLTKSLSKQGALDAVNLLIRSKKGPIRSKDDRKKDLSKNNSDSPETQSGNTEDTNQGENKKPESNQPKGKTLLMPDSDIFDVDDEEDEEIEDTDDDPGTTSSSDKKTKVSKVEDDDIDSDENIEKELKDIQIDQTLIQNKKIRQKEAEKAALDAYQKKITPADFSGFAQDLQRAAASQITIPPDPRRSFAKPNAIYADSGLLMPVKTYKSDIAKPVINVYFDKSGSLDDYQIEEGKSAVSVLDDFVKKDQLEYKVYWFSDWVVENEDDYAGDCTKAFPVILKHIKETNATNVIIFTDADFDRQTPNLDNLPFITVQGCVWWIWSGQSKALKSMKHIKGAKPGTTFQYTI